MDTNQFFLKSSKVFSILRIITNLTSYTSNLLLVFFHQQLLSKDVARCCPLDEKKTTTNFGRGFVSFFKTYIKKIIKLKDSCMDLIKFLEYLIKPTLLLCF